MSKQLFSVGNHKLGKDTLIFNFTSATECPSRRLGLCNHPGICYACRSERQYSTTCKPYRDRQKAWWHKVTARQFAQTVDTFVTSRRKIPIRYLRFSEAGDFEDQESVDKFTEACKLLWLWHEYNLEVYGYTARRDLDFTELMKVASVNGQEFMLTNKIVVKVPPKNAKHICPGNCRICNYCKRPVKGGVIYIAPH